MTNPKETVSASCNDGGSGGNEQRVKNPAKQKNIAFKGNFVTKFCTLINRKRSDINNESIINDLEHNPDSSAEATDNDVKSAGASESLGGNMAEHVYGSSSIISREQSLADSIRSFSICNTNVQELDPGLIDSAFLLFIDSSLALTNKAVLENQYVLADKLLCNIFRKMHEIYGASQNGISREVTFSSLDNDGLHPLFNLEMNIPANVPQNVRNKVEYIAKDPVYIRAIVEILFIYDILDKFNMLHIKNLCIDFHPPMLTQLWYTSLESAISKSMTNQTPSFDAENYDGEHLSLDSSIIERLDQNCPGNILSVVSDPNRAHGLTIVQAFGHIKAATKRIKRTKTAILKQNFKKLKIKTADGWVKEPYKSLEIYYRIESNGSVSIKVRGKLPCCVLKVLCILNELELSHEWVPFLKVAQELHSFSGTSKLFKQTYEYPVVGVKDTAVYGISMNALEEANCLIIGCRNPPDDDKDVELLSNVLKNGGIPDSEKVVRYDKASGKCYLWDHAIDKLPKKNRQRSADLCFLIFPIGEAHTLMELYANITPEVRLVPMKIITYIIKKVILGMFKKVANISKYFDDSPFVARMNENVEFYQRMKSVFEKYKINNLQNNKYSSCISICTYATSTADS